MFLVDAGKTGYVIDRKVIADIRKQYGSNYPDFLMKKNSYESQSILGKLYRKALEFKNSNPDHFKNQRLNFHSNTNKNVSIR